mmetsp:Transcript_32775/g.90447  ORF Transcript_32775/g.90447 Transcript_32775/m.90447 type:complete len:267 (-) Transcript_32775:774-1574(-)
MHAFRRGFVRGGCPVRPVQGCGCKRWRAVSSAHRRWRKERRRATAGTRWRLALDQARHRGRAGQRCGRACTATGGRLPGGLVRRQRQPQEVTHGHLQFPQRHGTIAVPVSCLEIPRAIGFEPLQEFPEAFSAIRALAKGCLQLNERKPGVNTHAVSDLHDLLRHHPSLRIDEWRERLVVGLASEGLPVWELFRVEGRAYVCLALALPALLCQLFLVELPVIEILFGFELLAALGDVRPSLPVVFHRRALEGHVRLVAGRLAEHAVA